MTNPRSEHMGAPGWTPPAQMQGLDQRAAVLDSLLTNLGMAGWRGTEGQVSPDPQCSQPTKGRHTCWRPTATHTVHVCTCGQTWNHEGLTYAEWRAREWGHRG